MNIFRKLYFYERKIMILEYDYQFIFHKSFQNKEISNQFINTALI